MKFVIKGRLIMKIKKVAVFAVAVMMTLSVLSIPVSADNRDSSFSIAITSTSGVTKNSISVRKKDDTTSSYLKYNAGPYKFIAYVYGASGSNGTYTDCTSIINGTNKRRRDAIVTRGTKGYIRQDVREKYGTSAWASLRGKYSSGLGTARGEWSPDSVPQSGCIEYNN